MDGMHNLIGIIKPTASYTTTWGNPFPIPPHPPAYPAITDDASAIICAWYEAEHALLVRDYASYDMADWAATKFICHATDENWYRDRSHAHSFYTNVTAKQLLEHLDAKCGGLHPSKLVNIPTDMMGYYANADGIPEYNNTPEEMQQKLACTNLPISNDQLLAVASAAMLAFKHAPCPTNKWEALPRASKTWTA